MNRWIPETNPVIVRRVGKTGEEAAELAAAAAQLACVCARVGIQGLAATDPSSGKTNRQRLIEEMADVQAQINTNIGVLLTDDEHRWLQQRTIEKMAQMIEWEKLYEPAGPTDEVKAARLAGYNTALVWNGRGSQQADSYEQIAAGWVDNQLSSK